MKRIAIKDLKWGELDSLKRECLYFDEIHFDVTSYQRVYGLLYSALGTSLDKDTIKAIFKESEQTVDYLVQKGIVVPYNAMSVLVNDLNAQFEPDKLVLKLPSGTNMDEETMIRFGEVLDREITYVLEENERKEIVIDENITAFVDQLMARNAQRAKFLSIVKGLADRSNVYTTILDEQDVLSPERMLREKEISNVIISKFVVPEVTVSWEQIVDFRTDAEAREKLAALRHWTTKLSRSGPINQAELEEEIDYLLHEYEKLLKLHKIRYEQSVLETIVVVSLEVLENLVKLNWSTAAKTMFNVRKRRVDFLLEETKLPGRELAYISHVNKRLKNEP